jgi:hypothetical protein
MHSPISVAKAAKAGASGRYGQLLGGRRLRGHQYVSRDHKNTHNFHGPAFAHAAFAHSTEELATRCQQPLGAIESAIYEGLTGDEIYSIRI